MTIWPISCELLNAILSDCVSDRFVSELVWEKLGYKPLDLNPEVWMAGEATPDEWQGAFPKAPEIIAERKASVALTRSIPKENKQLLKSQLNFPGYRIGQLYPRLTRRATAVNWLLSWLKANDEDLLVKGHMPDLLTPPDDPTRGHPGDLPVT